MSQTQALPLPADWRDFFALTKPRVMSLVIFTGLCGLLAAPVSINPVLGFTAILCIALGAGGAAALNMWWEADLDAGMKRTAARPPSGTPSNKVRNAAKVGTGLPSKDTSNAPRGGPSSAMGLAARGEDDEAGVTGMRVPKC